LAVSSSGKAPAATKGLVGGTTELRTKFSRFPEIRHRFFLSPLSYESDCRNLERFLRRERIAVEVGFGKGSFLANLADMNPDIGVVGLEVRRKFCVSALERLDRFGAENARILLGDVRDLLPRFLGPSSIDMLFILFPDPWWKKKHHRRRIWDSRFISMATPFLRPGGLVVVRSDVPLVLDVAGEAMDSHEAFERVDSPGFELPETDRERVCTAIGIPFSELCFRRCRMEEEVDGH